MRSFFNKINAEAFLSVCNLHALRQLSTSSTKAVKVLEHYHVSPPPGSVPPTSLPLTFLDIPFLLSVPVKRLFFFEFSHHTNHFMKLVLPTLKHSLSLTLQHFFPLAGNLQFPQPPAKPHLVYRDGDSVSLTIVESTDDFSNLTGNHPRDCKDFLPLIAELPPPQESGGSITYPVLALQVTIFPNTGICISITNVHMIDARTSSHFMKSWASVCNFGGDISHLNNSLPFYDRSIIKDPSGIEDFLLKQWYESNSVLLKGEIGNNLHNVRATFSLPPKDTEKMKFWIYSQCKDESQPLQLSTFSVASAFLWVCMQKTLYNGRNSSLVDDDEFESLFFLADYRHRFENPVPKTYFGNCLVMPQVNSKKGILLGENGLVLAAKAIANKVDEVKNKPAKGIEDWIFISRDISSVLVVAGSTKLKLYDTDFGWGKPKKTELVHMVDSTVVCLGDHKDEEGSIEIGVSLTKPEMQTFSHMFEQGIKIFSS